MLFGDADQQPSRDTNLGKPVSLKGRRRALADIHTQIGEVLLKGHKPALRMLGADWRFLENPRATLKLAG